MREWCAPPASHRITSNIVERRRRYRPTTNLVVLPVLLFVLGMPIEGLLSVRGMESKGESSPHPNTTERTPMGGLVSPQHVTNTSIHRFFPPKLTRTITKVPFRDNNGSDVDKHDMQSSLMTEKRKDNALDIARIWQISLRVFRRKRRSAAGESEQNSTTSSWTLQPTPVPTDPGGLSPTSSYITTVPFGSVQPDQHFETQYATASDSLQPTPTSSLGTTPPSPTTTISPRSTTPSATAPTRVNASNPPTGPLELTEAPARTDLNESTTPEPNGELSSTVAYTTRSHRVSRDAVHSSATPGEPIEAETQDISPSSSTPSSDVISVNSSMVVPSSTDITSSTHDVGSSPKETSAGQVPTQHQVDTYISWVTLKTSPSILIIMPVCVGLALLGLVGTGIKRWVLYRRLGRAVNLAQDVELLKEDNSYTIENPMPKSRRSYMNRHLEKTLNHVNKTDCKKSNPKNAPEDTQVRMEIATISGGSLRAPAGSLRRTASERTAPSRKQSSLKDCKCRCHCPLCGWRQGFRLQNGNSTTSTATTRL